MNNIEKLAEELRGINGRAEELSSELFYHRQSELFVKLQEVCSLLIVNTKEPTTCGGDGYIERGISKISFKDFENRIYPASFVEWYLEGNNFVCKIEAEFRGERDNCSCISFPIREVDFEKYIATLTEKANERKKQLDKINAQEQLKKEQEEKEMFAKLKEKYDRS